MNRISKLPASLFTGKQARETSLSGKERAAFSVNSRSMRKCAYIRAGIHDIIARIANLSPGRDLTIGGFTGRVLSGYPEANKEEINGLYRRGNLIKPENDD